MKWYKERKREDVLPKLMIINIIIIIMCAKQYYYKLRLILELTVELYLPSIYTISILTISWLYHLMQCLVFLHTSIYRILLCSTYAVHTCI